MLQRVEVLHTTTAFNSLARLAHFVLPLRIPVGDLLRKSGAFTQVSFTSLLLLIWLEAPLVDSSDLELVLVRN